MASHWEIVSSAAIVTSNTPQELWKNACNYFLWCDTNPVKYKRTITSGKEVGRKVKIESPRPYNLKALCLHCGIDEEYLRDIRGSTDRMNDYYIVVSKILYIIYVQNVEYATVNVFNPIFTAKILNLDKEEVPSSEIKINHVQGLPELAESENEILEKLESEGELFKSVGAENIREKSSDDELSL